MKKILSTVFILALVAVIMTACSTSTDAEQTPQSEQTAQYASAQQLADIIVSVRDDDMNAAFAVLGAQDGDAATYLHNPMEVPQDVIDSEIAGISQLTGINIAECNSYAYSLSMMNIHAYFTGVFYPEAGSEEALMESLNSFVAAKQAEFENYLPDQYEIVKDAQIRTTSDGAVILVIAENSQQVADEIEQAL